MLNKALSESDFLLYNYRGVFFRRLIKWLDQISWPSLLMIATLLGLAPFSPEPHLIEKWRMCSHGEMSRGIDVFDLLVHATPVLLVVLKLVREGVVRGRTKTT